MSTPRRNLPFLPGFGQYDELQDYELGLPKYRKSLHTAHCMIYANIDDQVPATPKPRIGILMQMRFDGYIGFPGGMIDAGEDVAAGLNRELVEEMNLDINQFAVKCSDHIISHWWGEMDIVHHMYAKKVTFEEFQFIEKEAIKAKDFGDEVMGIFRVPVYTLGDGYRGLPAFLENNFIGNSKAQLLCTLKVLNILNDDEIFLANNAKGILLDSINPRPILNPPSGIRYV